MEPARSDEPGGQVRRGFGEQRQGRKYFSKYFQSDDGLNVLRVDELYDNDTGWLETNDAWRAREANTHRPGSLGALLAKRVYEYPSGTSGTSNGNEDYY